MVAFQAFLLRRHDLENENNRSRLANGMGVYAAVLFLNSLIYNRGRLLRGIGWLRWALRHTSMKFEDGHSPAGCRNSSYLSICACAQTISIYRYVYSIYMAAPVFTIQKLCIVSGCACTNQYVREKWYTDHDVMNYRLTDDPPIFEFLINSCVPKWLCWGDRIQEFIEGS